MGWPWHCHHNYSDYKIKEIEMHRMHKQRGWVVWCPHLLHEVFEIWPFFNQIEHIHNVSLENNQVKAKVQGAYNAMNYCFTSTLVTTLNWCGEKYIAKASRKWRHKMQLVNQYNISPMTMGQTFKSLITVERWVSQRICAIWHEMWPWMIWKQSWNNCENPLLQSSRWKLSQP